jgi:RNA polymerase sigma factor (TIGR02999 family)
MSDLKPSSVTALLRAWGTGDLRARDDLLPLVYQELRKCARAYLQRERSGHSLQPTALVHEAYLRLVGQDRIAWRNRAQFFGVAAHMMRRILVDHARARDASKRSGAAVRTQMSDSVRVWNAPDVELLLLDQALDELGRLDARQLQIVEMRYFGGLSEDEVAAALSLSRSTVARNWRIARAWLSRRMTRGARP